MFALILGFFLVACDDETPAKPVEQPAVETPAPAAVVAPEDEPPAHPATSDARMAASHVLISFVGAMSNDPKVTRNRADARTIAETVQKKAAAGEDFAALAKQYSDDSTKSRGGELGNFAKGTMVGPFETAVLALKVGEVSPVVESPFGFHVIKREAMNQVHCGQIIVAFAESARPVEGVTRGKDEAKARADAAKAELVSGASWEVVAHKYSDGPGHDDQGDFGWFSRRQLMPVLDDAAFALDIGQNSDVLESPVGFHILHRFE